MNELEHLAESATDGQTTATVLELPAFQVTAGESSNRS